MGGGVRIIPKKAYLQQVVGLEAISVLKCCPEGEAVRVTGPGQSAHCETRPGSETETWAEIEIQAFNKAQPGVAVTQTLKLTSRESGDQNNNLPPCSHTEFHRIKLSKNLTSLITNVVVSAFLVLRNAERELLTAT